MARMTFEEMNEKAERQSNFTRKEFTNTLLLRDKESAFIIPLLKEVSDVEVHSIHKVTMTSKQGKTYLIDVDCLGKGCPMCKAAVKYEKEKYPLISKPKDMVYIPIIRLYDNEKEFSPQYMILSRSTKWFRNTYVEAASRYDMSAPLEVVRSGTGIETTWNIYPATKAHGQKIPAIDVDTLIADLDIDIPSSLYGEETSVVRNWTAEQMEQFIETGSYSYSNNNEEEDEEEVKPRGSKNFGF